MALKHTLGLPHTLRLPLGSNRHRTESKQNLSISSNIVDQRREEVELQRNIFLCYLTLVCWSRWRVSLKGGFQISKPLDDVRCEFRGISSIVRSQRVTTFPLHCPLVEATPSRLCDARAHSIPLIIIRPLSSGCLSPKHSRWSQSVETERWKHRNMSINGYEKSSRLTGPRSQTWQPTWMFYSCFTHNEPMSVYKCGEDNCGIGHCNDCLHQGRWLVGDDNYE